MSKICQYNSLHGSLMHATGHRELWMDWDCTSKFSQHGWRCTTNENDYSEKALMEDWNEEQYEIQRTVQPNPLPSQDLNKNLIGFQATTMRWNLLHSAQLFNPVTQETTGLHMAAFSLLVSSTQRRNKKDARKATEVERICTLCLQKNRRPVC